MKDRDTESEYYIIDERPNNDQRKKMRDKKMKELFLKRGKKG